MDVKGEGEVSLMEYSFHSSQWKWKEFDIHNDEQAKELAKKHRTCKKWIEDVQGDKMNSLQMYTGKPGQEVMWGSLVYTQDPEEKQKKKLFHFYLSNEELITANLDLSVLDHADVKAMKEKMHDSVNPVEGFMALLGELMSHYLVEIDSFERRLRDLLWDVKERNNTRILDKVAKTDHELLIWKNLIVPIREIVLAVQEAFGEEAGDGKQFKRTRRRVERARELIQEYEEEIDALLDLENVVSSHRGNEIMKTLTVITTLFTPVMALGAIWGMNFKHMPELDWRFGYLFAGTLIALCTLALYVFLKKKGWMGDILSVHDKKSFFK